MKKAIFIDRDGTLNEMVYDDTHGLMDSPRRAEQVRLVRGAGRFLKAARELGFMVIVVTNQPGIAKGTLTEAELDAVNRRLADLLAEEGGRWDELRYSPWHPQGGPGGRAEFIGPSDTRKPAPGMLLEAAREHGIYLPASWMIGDGIVDVQAGRAAGCRTILLATVKLEQVERFVNMERAEPDHVARSLDEALEIIRSGLAC